ncbi:hypothetical protein VE03_00589 [Pseudogymnoascus sp. 23342-1-I1]|nr:hypothetical protein VE03_00589 [Pseudogymnoascus sp. 23342-1-I1]
MARFLATKRSGQTLDALLYAMEAALTFLFWTVQSTTKDYGGFDICCPWPRDSFSYGGLCSHSPLADKIHGDLRLSPEQLKEAAEVAKAKAVEYHAECYQLERACSPERVRAERDRSSKKYRKDHPDRVRKNEKTSMARAVELKKYYCDTCCIAFRQLRELKKHDTSRRHLQEIATTAGVLGDYHCHACNTTTARKPRQQENHDNKKTTTASG